ncbi:MAG: hypothetical protein WCR49_04970 [Opitutae bacterium]
MSAAIFAADGQLLCLALRDRYQHPAFGYPELRGWRWLEFVHEDDFASSLPMMTSPRSTATYRLYAPPAQRWFDIQVDKESFGSRQFCLLHISPSSGSIKTEERPP